MSNNPNQYPPAGTGLTHWENPMFDPPTPKDRERALSMEKTIAQRGIKDQRHNLGLLNLEHATSQNRQRLERQRAVQPHPSIIKLLEQAERENRKPDPIWGK